MTLTQSRRQAALALASVCIAGALLGGAAVHSYSSRDGRPPQRSASEYRARLLDKLGLDLGLDQDQRDQVEGILDETDQRFISVREAIEPEFEAIRNERADRIMSLLDPEQQIKYGEILEERRRRREADYGSRGHR